MTAWSLAERRVLAAFDTVLDAGGHRLALCQVGGEPLVAAGAWERHGVCGYSLDGELVWQRKDLKRPQVLEPAGAGDLVAACLEARPLHVLDAETGETVTTLRAVEDFAQGPHDPGVAAVSRYEQVSLVDTATWKRRWSADLTSFATTDLAFGPESLLVCEVGGPVRCFASEGGELWSWSPPDEEQHVVAATRDPDAWVGLLYHVNHKTPDTLLRWSPEGELTEEIELGGVADAWGFLPGGGHLVAGGMGVIDTRDGSLVWELEA